MKNKNQFKVYLDYAATTPLDKKVFKIMQPFFLKNYGNPNSLHFLGQISFQALNNSRQFIAQKLNCNFDEIIFTGSATEANNLFIQGVIEQFKVFYKHFNLKYQPKIITSSIEHESVLEIFKKYEKEGFKIIYLPVDKFGFVKLKNLKENLDETTILISIMSANNEIGTIQNIKKISKIIEEYKKEKIKKNKDSYPLFHTDAVQYYQYFKIDLKEINVHGLTLSAHKIYGPKGIGLLYLKKIKHFIFKKIEILNFQPIKPLILGGGQEFNFRSGTQNIPYIVGFKKAIELIEKNRSKNYQKIEKLRNWFLKEIKKIDKRIKINSLENTNENKTLPNILNIYLPKYNSQEWLIKLDLKGICVSTGSACLSRISQPSYVLKALKLDDKIIRQSLRFSLGQFTNINDLKYTIKTIKEILKN